MIRPFRLTIVSSSPRLVPSPIELLAASRQRRSNVRWLAFAAACMAVGVGMAIGWWLS